MPRCLICESPFEPFISLGRQPVANAFLAPGQYTNEFFYDLKIGMCPECRMVQLTDLVDEKRMFHEAYAFFSGTSQGMAVHFEQFAADVRARHLNPKAPFVVELGSNDGIMLRHFARAGVRHLGVEPSANVAAVATAAGVRTVTRFFDEKLAKEILSSDGQADAILGANVICHIPYLHSVVRGIRALLKPKGVFVFEEPYLEDIVQKTSYDQIYDEHIFYFSLSSLSRLFEMNDMEIVDVEPQPTHGGQIRYTVMHRGAGRATPQVAAFLQREQSLGLNEKKTFDELGRRIEVSKHELVALLRKLKSEGKRVVGYGATSKSTTVINFCGITGEFVEYISDTTPIKQGKVTPGMHIPVRPYSEFQKNPPEYALLFAWNHAAEIMAKEADFIAKGGRFIMYVPRVHLAP